MKSKESLSYGKIFRFWLPLAVTWIMMSVEGPFLASIIARLADEKVNLAAYGVAYAFALIAESPIIMLMSASTALCRDRDSYLKLRNFSIVLSIGVTLLLALFLIPPIFDLFAITLIGLPDNIAQLVHTTLLFLLPWPGAIGLRRFYQGVLIAQHQTRRIVIATLSRLLMMAGISLFLYYFSTFPGAVIGGIALAGGVATEALFTRILTHRAIHTVLQIKPDETTRQMGYREIREYYIPLALTPFIALSVHPLVTFFLGKCRDPLESLAVMPVIYGLTFIFRAIGLSYQEVAIALLGESWDNYKKVRNFAIVIGLATSGGLTLIAFTPLSHFWFMDLSGLSEVLTQFAIPPLKIMAIFPALTVLICFQRTMLIITRRTKPISFSTATEAAGIFLVLLVAMLYLPISGAIAASIAYVAARIVAIALLQRPLKYQMKQFHQQRGA